MNLLESRPGRTVPFQLRCSFRPPAPAAGSRDPPRGRTDQRSPGKRRGRPPGDGGGGGNHIVLSREIAPTSPRALTELAVPREGAEGGPLSQTLRNHGETRWFPHSRPTVCLFLPSPRLIARSDAAAPTNGKPSLYATANTVVDSKLRRRRGEGRGRSDTRANYPYVECDKSWLQFALYYLQHCFLRNPFPSLSRLSLSLSLSLSFSPSSTLIPPSSQLLRAPGATDLHHYRMTRPGAFMFN